MLKVSTPSLDNLKYEITPFIYKKTYTLDERFKKVINFFNKGMKDIWNHGFYESFQNSQKRMAKILSGNTDKTPLKLVRINTKNYQVTAPTIDKKSIMQQNVNKADIPLNIENTPKQNTLNDFNRENINKFLNYKKKTDGLTDDEVSVIENKIYANLDKITVKDLEENLAACTLYLNTLIQNDYTVGFSKNKSSCWIASQAIPHMDKTPKNRFVPKYDTGGEIPTDPEITDNELVIYDDASYSGNQIESLLMHLNRSMRRQSRQANVYLVIPFISELALDRLNYALEASSKRRELNLKIHLITSDKKVKQVKDVLPNSTSSQCVSFMEWKTPDGLSIEPSLRSVYLDMGDGERDCYDFLTNYQPCYKE